MVGNPPNRTIAQNSGSVSKETIYNRVIQVQTKVRSEVEQNQLEQLRLWKELSRLREREGFLRAVIKQAEIAIETWEIES